MWKTLAAINSVVIILRTKKLDLSKVSYCNTVLFGSVLHLKLTNYHKAKEINALFWLWKNGVDGSAKVFYEELSVPANMKECIQ